MKDHKAPPSAASLIESMRDIGYSFETALADIVDNSIAANSKVIDIFCDADANPPMLAILDDGEGMTERELLNAMRPGSANPLADRREGDLGRFGLGLKTASFSQCRRLSVITRRNSATSAAQWDLDYVAKKDDWLLRIPDASKIRKLPFFDRLGPQGTLVVWEVLDRLADQTHKTSLKDHLYEQIDNARRHLELVFHRYLSGEKRYSKVVIKINGRAIDAFDPFHSTHPATQRQPEEKIKIAGAVVRVQPFVLPHHNKATRGEWERYAGEGGYLQNQGFYVYRTGRLIVHGTWFRLIKQSELTKLARVRVDMPIELDHLWKLDVKKASASPPLVVRQRLKAIIDKIAGASNRIYTQRGRRIDDTNTTPFWARRIDKNQVSYELNRQNPTIAGFFETLDDNQSRDFDALLHLVERSFPTDALFSDIASRPESVSTNAVDQDLLASLIGLTVGYLRNAGLSNDQITEQIYRSDPYKSNWAVAEPLLHVALQGLENA